MALAGLDNLIYHSVISASSRYYPCDIVDPYLRLIPTAPLVYLRGRGAEVNETVMDGYIVSREMIRI